MFVYSLVREKITAGIGTIMLLFGLQSVGAVGQRVPVLSNVTDWISVADRAELLVAGHLNSRDVVYFVVVATAVIILAIPM